MLKSVLTIFVLLATPKHLKDLRLARC